MVVGYGATYHEAMEDAKRKLDEQRNAEMAVIGGAALGAGMLATAVASFLSVGWVLFNAALRPIPGVVFMIFIAGIIWGWNQITQMIFADANGDMGVLGVVVFGFGIIALLIGGARVAKSAMLSIEGVEASLLYRCFTANGLFGRLVHMMAYGVTAVVSYVFSGLLILFFANLLVTFDVVTQADVNIEHFGLFMVDAPIWAFLTAGVLVLLALGRRLEAHPFAAHFTVDGRLKPNSVPSSEKVG